MTFRSNVDSTSNILPNRYNKFWTKSIMEDIDDVSATTANMVMLEDDEDEPPVHVTTKRYQTKMLLASLLEHFCRAYGDTPDANRKVFFLICQTLRSLGIIDAEFVDEMTNVRSAFQQAFHKLFFTAVQTVRNQDLVHFDDTLPVLRMDPPEEDDIFAFSCSSTSEDENTPEPSSATTSSSPSINYSSTQSHINIHSSSNRLSTSVLSASSFHSIMGDDSDLFYNLSIQNSRYNNDFVEIGLLGKGGFASAYRARNKLDGIYYAIKKIRLGNDIKQDDQYEKIFREIKSLARLEHHNVIRYYASWLEFDESNDQASTDDSDWEEDTSRSYSGRHSGDDSSVFRDVDPYFSEHSASSWRIGRDDDSGISQIQFGECSTSDYVARSKEVSEGATPWTTTPPAKLSIHTTPIQKKSGWTLFIQMQLCPTTLHDYICFRNKQYAKDLSFDAVDTRRNIQIFSQILEGTAYIHDQGLIHRDLKPSNIFLSMPSPCQADGRGRRRRVSSAGPCLESSKHSSSFSSTSTCSSPETPQFLFENSLWEEPWVPKIGDFGLAAQVMDDHVLIPTPISSRPSSPRMSASDKKSRRPEFKRTRTIGVGTRTYASPEQLAVPAQAYDEKVDIYSLGIILFELFHPFATGMERADSLDKLKRGVFPQGFLELYPKVSALIIWMMDKDPRQRPTAQQLLAFELFAHPSTHQDDLCLNLKTQLQSKINLLDRKNKEIDDLKLQVKQVEFEKQAALNDMQRRLEEMQLKLNQYEQPVKKGILTPTSSFLKRKKEVRWTSCK